MADFDAIYEEEEENDEPLDDPYVKMVPDPVTVRGAGNMTVLVFKNFTNYLGFQCLCNSWSDNKGFLERKPFNIPFKLINF